MHVMKKKAEEGEDEEFWPRLLKDKALEKNQVRICCFFTFMVPCFFGMHCLCKRISVNSCKGEN